MKENLQKSKLPLLITTGLLIGMMVVVYTASNAQSYKTLSGMVSKKNIKSIEKMGMIESTDHSITWKFKGYAQLHAPELNPVDPSIMFDNGELVLYFFDLNSLMTDTAVVYRTHTTDGGGLDFSPPTKAFQFAGYLTDPAVVRLPSGKYRMYVHGPNAILSATSVDGKIFKLDTGARTTAGGVPGAIVLPDGRVRLFVCGAGIISLISEDGLSFTLEPGVRIPIQSGAAIVADPHPIRSTDGMYLMAYKVRPTKEDRPELDEVFFAESIDGFTWTPGSTSLIKGSVPTLVELPDRTLRIYYVDFQSTEPSGLFKFIKTIYLTPDAKFKPGGFVRVYFVPTTNRLIVTLGAQLIQPLGGYTDAGYSYREYTLDMQETGKTGIISYKPKADVGSLMIDNIFYLVSMYKISGDSTGWLMEKFDAVNWNSLGEIFVLLDYPKEKDNDPMVAFVNGQLDLSSQYDLNITPPDLMKGAATHHSFYSLNLKLQSKKILADTPHICGSSMIFVDDIYYFITADAFLGDMVVMKYDKNWKYLGVKKLIKQAHWSMGLAFDGLRFYVAYLNTSQRLNPTNLPVYLNVHLAAFDRDWNLIEDVAVTKYAISDNKQTGRPWVLLHNNRLYISYDLDSMDAVTRSELGVGKPAVSVYELTPGSSSIKQTEEVPSEFRLEQNYPNPFNPTTTIMFSLTNRQMVTLKVYDILGRVVVVLLNEVKQPGKYTLTFNVKDLSSGMYFYKLQAGEFVATKKLIVLK
jgi:hypothetical protein